MKQFALFALINALFGLINISANGMQLPGCDAQYTYSTGVVGNQNWLNWRGCLIGAEDSALGWG